MNKIEKIEEIIREYENGCDADVTAEKIIEGIKNVINDNEAYTSYEAKKLRKEKNSLLVMKGNQHIPFKTLVDALEELPFNKTISIAEDAEEEEGWWNLTKLDIGDGKTLLCNYWGGGYPYSFSIDEMGDTETVEYALKEFFRFAFNMSEDNGLLDEDTEVCVEFESEDTQQEE